MTRPPTATDCIRCSDAPAVDPEGYCGHCHWAVRAETEAGLYQLRKYLRNYTAYEQWCETHGRAA